MSIKRVDSKKTFKIVSRYDDALAGTKEEKDAAYEKFTESFDLGDLKFKDGEAPTYFVVRCLTNAELAALNEAHMVVDSVAKTIKYDRQTSMFMEMFDLAVVGMDEKADGNVSPVKSDEIPYQIAVEIGSVISLMTSAGANLKKD